MEKTMENIFQLPLVSIVVDKEFQSRVKLEPDVIEEYKDSILNEDELPPIEIFDVDGKYYLIDGFHRYYAFKKLNRTSIPAHLTKGEHFKAVQASLKANTAHGLRRTVPDKHNIIRKALDDIEFGSMSDRELAFELKVSPVLVKKIRTAEGKPKSINKFTTKRNLQLADDQKVNVIKNAHQEASTEINQLSSVELNNVENELKEESIQHLIAENENLNQRLAMKAFIGTEEEKNALNEIIDQLKKEVYLLTKENTALKNSRDTYQQENAQLKRQIYAINKEIKELKVKA